MAAGLGDTPLVEHENTVRVDHAAEPVREDQCRAADHQAVQGVLDDRLVLRVDRRQRLVQYQDRRVAQNRTGDGDALPLTARQADAALADHRVVALRQLDDESMRIGGTAGFFEFRQRCTRLANAQIVTDRAMEQVGVLVDDGDLATDLREAEVSQVAAADLHRAVGRVVEAQQEPDDGGLANAAGADETDPLARRDVEAEAFVRGAPAARIGEGHVLETDRRRHSVCVRAARVFGDDRLRVEQMEYRLGRGLRDHAVMHKRTHVAQRPEHFDAHHQDHDQGGQCHIAVDDPVRAERQGRRRTHRDARIGDAAGERVGRQDPHGQAEDVVRLYLQDSRARAALAEGFQGRQPLHGVEEFGGERLVGPRPVEAVLLIPAVKSLRRDQGEQRRDQHDEGDGPVEKGDETEDQERRQNGDDQLRQVLAEIDFELLDPVDHRHDRIAGPLQPEMRRTKLGHLVEDDGAQVDLDLCRRIMRDHRAQIFQPAAHEHDGGDAGERPQQFVQRHALEDPGNQPAEQCQPRDAEHRGQDADRYGGEYAAANALRKSPKPKIEIHP